jgi:Uncharacterized protein conserved in bacteria
MKRIVVTAAGVLVALVGAGPAWGHATLETATAPPDSHADLTLHVPVEKADTVNSKIEVELPEGFEAHSCTAEAGWSCTVGDPDKPELITFTRLGTVKGGHGHGGTTPASARFARLAEPMHGEPGPGPAPEPGHPGEGEGAEGEHFCFAVHTPATPGDYPIAVKQHYANGDRATWDEPAGSEKPAPVLTVG